MYWEDRLIGFTSALYMLSGTIKWGYRGHRTVILPDFQGLGIGSKLRDFIGDYYLSRGFRFYSRTAHIRVGKHLEHHPYWISGSSNGRVSNKDHSYERDVHYDQKRICYSFEYLGKNYEKPPFNLVVDKCPTINAKLIAKLNELNSKYFLTVHHGDTKTFDDFDSLCRDLGLRTALLYLRKNERVVKKKITKDMFFLEDIIDKKV